MNVTGQLIDTESYYSAQNIELNLKGGSGVCFVEIVADLNAKALFKLLKQ
jgi:hypothetical protein